MSGDVKCGHGIVRAAGWEKKRGKEQFRVIISYPDGPPKGEVFRWVFSSEPVEIVAVAEIEELRALKAREP